MANNEFEQYYHNVRARQKRDTVVCSFLIIAIYLVAGHYAEFSPVTIWNNLPAFFSYLYDILPTLHWADLFKDVHTQGSFAYWGYRLPLQLSLIWETIQLSISSTIVSVVIATIFAFLCANNVHAPFPLRYGIRIIAAFLRTMPELAWAVIFVMAFGIGPIPGFLAMAMHSIGSLTKLFYDGIESAEDKPVRGLAACGASSMQQVRFGLWSQVKPLFLSYSFMRLEINFRTSTVLGLVGAGGIGQELMTNIDLNRYDQVGITLLLIVVVVTLMDMLSEKLRHWLLERES